jgi:CheY-like chemotaxis protein
VAQKLSASSEDRSTLHIAGADRGPAAVAAPVQTGARASGRENPAVAAHRVLVVDDNRDAAYSLKLVLEILGYSVSFAFDGGSAIARAAEFRPTIAMLDIGLPDMDGYQLATVLRRQQPPPLLVAITGRGEHEDRMRAKEVGFSHHILKPVDFVVLQQVLEGAAGLLPQTDAS